MYFPRIPPTLPPPPRSDTPTWSSQLSAARECMIVGHALAPGQPHREHVSKERDSVPSPPSTVVGAGRASPPSMIESGLA